MTKQFRTLDDQIAVETKRILNSNEIAANFDGDWIKRIADHRVELQDSFRKFMILYAALSGALFLSVVSSDISVAFVGMTFKTSAQMREILLIAILTVLAPLGTVVVKYTFYGVILTRVSEFKFPNDFYLREIYLASLKYSDCGVGDATKGVPNIAKEFVKIQKRFDQLGSAISGIFCTPFSEYSFGHWLIFCARQGSTLWFRL